MRHKMNKAKLGRTSAHRRAMFANLAVALFKHEQIRTTLAKAKALRPIAEKLITRGKSQGLHSRRCAESFLQDRKVSKKLFETLGKRFAARNGGYTRIVKTSRRIGDGAEMAIVELLERDKAAKGTDAGPTKTAAENRRKEEAQRAENPT